MATERFANSAQTTLMSAIDNSTPTVNVVSNLLFPGSGNFRIRIDDELLLVTGVSGTTWTATRGAESTTAAAHSSGAAVVQVLTASAMNALAAVSADQGANTVLAGPASGGGAAPAFRALVSGDLPDNGVTDAKLRDSAAASVIGRAAGSTGDPADIAAALSSGAGLLAFKDTTDTVEWKQGSGVPVLDGGDVSLGNAPLAYGGTGASLTGPLADSILFWDQSAGQVAWLTAGTGLSITGNTISATGSSGTVTSVGLSVPSFLSVSGSPVTTSGTLAVSLATQTANTVFAGPASGGATAPTFRALAAADLPAFTGLTDADPALTDELPGYDASATANRKFLAGRLLGLQPPTPGGRLTLTSGVPVTTSDVTGATSVKYTPCASDRVTLWDGTRWVAVIFSEVSLALGTLAATRPYDVFAYLSGGALAIEMLAWTNDATRATAVTIQDGRYCKSGDKTRLLLGTFRTVTATTTEDSSARRFLSNVYNREPRRLFVCPGYTDDDTVTTYSVTSTTWALAHSTGTAELLLSLPGRAAADCHFDATSPAASNMVVGAGVDNPVSPPPPPFTPAVAVAGFIVFGTTASVCVPVGRMFSAGYHNFSLMARVAGGTGTLTADRARNGAAGDPAGTLIEGWVMG